MPPDLGNTLLIPSPASLPIFPAVCNIPLGLSVDASDLPLSISLSMYCGKLCPALVALAGSASDFEPSNLSANLPSAGLTSRFNGNTNLFIIALSASPTRAPRLTTALVAPLTDSPSLFLPSWDFLISASCSCCAFIASSLFLRSRPLAAAIASSPRTCFICAPAESFNAFDAAPPASPNVINCNLAVLFISAAAALRPSAAAAFACISL